MYKPILFLCLSFFVFSCKISRNSMREANYQLWLHLEDLDLSERVTGKASQNKVFLVDWERLFGKKSYEYGGFGDLPSDPTSSNVSSQISGSGIQAGQGSVQTAFNVMLNGVIGLTSASRVEQMAMYDLIQKNPGYDLVMFPTFQTHKKWFVIGSNTEVICTAKLGKLKASK
jgi:hypothetical protein